MITQVVFPTPFHSVLINKKKYIYKLIYEPVTSIDIENWHTALKELTYYITVI